MRLSDEAFTAGLPAQKHLLRGLFTADGRVRRRHARADIDKPGLPRRRAAIAAGLRRAISIGTAVASNRYLRAHAVLHDNGYHESDGGAVARGELSDRHETSNALVRAIRRAATQNPDATACVSIRAASAFLLNTSACSPAEKLEQLAAAIDVRHRPRLREGNFDRVATLHAARQAAGLRPHRAASPARSSPTG